MAKQVEVTTPEIKKPSKMLSGVMATALGCSSVAVLVAVFVAVGYFCEGLHLAFEQEDIKGRLAVDDLKLDLIGDALVKIDEDERSIVKIGFAAYQFALGRDFEQAEQALNNAPEFATAPLVALAEAIASLQVSDAKVEQTQSDWEAAHGQRIRQFRHYERVRGELAVLLRQEAPATSDADTEMGFYQTGLFAHLPVLPTVPDGITETASLGQYLGKSRNDDGSEVIMTPEEFKKYLGHLAAEATQLEMFVTDRVVPAEAHATEAREAAYAAAEEAEVALSARARTLLEGALAPAEKRHSVQVYQFAKNYLDRYLSVALPNLQPRERLAGAEVTPATHES